MLPCVLGKGEYAFSLLSLEQIRRVKGYFQNRDALLTDFPDYFSKEDIGRMADARLRPYLFHTKWFPFAEYCDSCYLMLDFAPGKAGKEGQILCYVHDPDSVTYAAENITDVVGSIIKDNHIDIITLTSYKRNIFARLFNPSIARKMIFHSDTPLLVINS